MFILTCIIIYLGISNIIIAHLKIRFYLKYWPFIVAYWPPTRPSCQNKKCTCVNDRCIWSSILGYNLDCRGVELSAKLWRSQEEEWMSNYYITSATGSWDAVERTSTQQRGPKDPRLSSWSSDLLERRCWNEDRVPERLGPQSPGWAAQENGKETLLWP